MSARVWQPNISSRRIAVTLATAGFVGGVLFGPSLATAAQKVGEVFITNTASDPVPVRQQGTADVNVTNSSVTIAAAPVTGGGGTGAVAVNVSHGLLTPAVASAISITMASGVGTMELWLEDQKVAGFDGPQAGGHAIIDLALTRPISFNSIRCIGSSGSCHVGWIGNVP